jgi:ABC-type protease/lipase transport system fused ATPase/permease subunit
VLLFDEPNAHLDAEGEAQLLQTIAAAKARGAATALVAHRMSVLSVSDKVLVLRDGRVEAFGKRDEVIARLQGPPQGDVRSVRAKPAKPKAVNQ